MVAKGDCEKSLFYADFTAEVGPIAPWIQWQTKRIAILEMLGLAGHR
jgi:hypothetical protein